MRVSLGGAVEPAERTLHVAGLLERSRGAGVELARLSKVSQRGLEVADRAIGLAAFEVAEHRLGLQRDGAAEGFDGGTGLVGRQGGLALGNEAAIFPVAAGRRPGHGRCRPDQQHATSGEDGPTHRANPIRGRLGGGRQRPKSMELPGLPVSNSATNRSEWPGRSGLAIVGVAPVAEDLAVPSAGRPGSWQDVEDREATLVARCAQGDEAACVDLVNEHQRMVFQLAYHLLGDRDEALDLSQDVFFKVFRTLSQFRGQSQLRTWIYRIVVNQARNRQRWWRRRHRSSQVSLDLHVSLHGDPAGEAQMAPDRLFARKELGRRLWTALESLPFDQRSVVVLREIDGLSYEEIAFSLGVTLGTVKSRLTRARQALRSVLQEATP
jgi:RNA polymerase sigma-70 factor (ECF subfamily)